MSDVRVHTFCPEHGINCKIDDDGTCSSCGASAVGPALDEIERLRERIEELEKQLDTSNDAFQKLTNFGNKINEHYCEHGEYPHIIPRDKIRAAWEMIRALRRINTKTSRIAADALEDLLETFNIVRCEGVVSTTTSTTAVKCPGCNGEGWVIGGEDEYSQ